MPPSDVSPPTIAKKECPFSLHGQRSKRAKNDHHSEQGHNGQHGFGLAAVLRLSNVCNPCVEGGVVRCGAEKMVMTQSIITTNTPASITAFAAGNSTLVLCTVSGNAR